MVRSGVRYGYALAAGVVLMLGLPAAPPAIADEGAAAGPYAGMLGGVAWPDRNRDADYGISLQGLIGYPLDRGSAVELSVFAQRLPHETDSGHDRAVGATFDLHLGARRAGAPFLLIGGGAVYEESRGRNNVSPVAGAGLGIYLPLDIGADLVRLEARWDGVFGDKEVIPANGGDRRDEFRLSFGVVVGAVKSPPPAAGPKLGPAVDSDGDGIPDVLDECPGTSEWLRVDQRGCPFDTDGDGVHDGEDRCPGTAPGAEVDAEGCSAEQRDSDADGVADAHDRCPGTAPGAEVDAAGCSAERRDSDGDGVVDARDRCPDSAPGAAVDAEGCPLLTDLENQVVYFYFQSRMTAESYKLLDRIAAALTAIPTMVVEIGGYTDSSGWKARDDKLSQERAQTVRDYLKWRGVPEERMVLRAYGGVTGDDLRARRVEFKVLQP